MSSNQLTILERVLSFLSHFSAYFLFFPSLSQVWQNDTRGKKCIRDEIPEIKMAECTWKLRRGGLQRNSCFKISTIHSKDKKKWGKKPSNKQKNHPKTLPIAAATKGDRRAVVWLYSKPFVPRSAFLGVARGECLAQRYSDLAEEARAAGLTYPYEQMLS